MLGNQIMCKIFIRTLQEVNNSLKFQELSYVKEVVKKRRRQLLEAWNDCASGKDPKQIKLNHKGR